MKDILEYLTLDKISIRIPIKMAEAIIAFVEDEKLEQTAHRYEDFYNELKKHFGK